MSLSRCGAPGATNAKLQAQPGGLLLALLRLGIECIQDDLPSAIGALQNEDLAIEVEGLAVVGKMQFGLTNGMMCPNDGDVAMDVDRVVLEIG